MRKLDKDEEDADDVQYNNEQKPLYMITQMVNESSYTYLNIKKNRLKEREHMFTLFFPEIKMYPNLLVHLNQIQANYTCTCT